MFVKSNDLDYFNVNHNLKKIKLVNARLFFPERIYICLLFSNACNKE